jgi:hypothetical protein
MISIHLDPQTGLVVDFSYQWTYIEGIPTEEIVEKAEGENFALSYISQESNLINVQVSYSTLLFKDFGSTDLISYKLCWAIYTDSSEFGVVYVNAKSGEVISTDQYGVISEFIDNTRLNLIFVLIPISLSIISATAAFIAVNYYVGKRLPIAEEQL